MNVLLLGADGFLGRHLQIALESAGHTVRRGVTRPVRRADEIAVIAMGLMVLCMRGAWLWGVQILVVLGYTFIVTTALPKLWLRPFGPLLKNLPILAGLTLLFYLERR